MSSWAVTYPEFGPNALDNDLRGTLRNFGLKVGVVDIGRAYYALQKAGFVNLLQA